LPFLISNPRSYSVIKANTKGHGWVKSWEVQQLVPDETEAFEPPQPDAPVVPLEMKQKRAKSKRSLKKEGLQSHNFSPECLTPMPMSCAVNWRWQFKGARLLSNSARLLSNSSRKKEKDVWLLRVS
jgi:hypothetical protein